MKALKIGIPVILIAASLWLVFSPPARVGYAPEQPIHYSHKLHAGELGIDCQYCHTTVAKGKKASVPSISICMNCHTSVATNKEEIKKLSSMWQAKKSPEWVRIHNMPDHVRFSHAPQIKALLSEGKPSSEACQHCHGDVTKMEVVAQVKDHNMGWCVNCHRDNKEKGANITCSTCHY